MRGQLRTGFVSLAVVALITLGLVACFGGKVLEVEIEPELAPHAECGGLEPRPCMMMHGPDGREAIHWGIKGFDYEEGYTWTLKVKRTKAEGPFQTDSPSHVYTLIEVISKVPVE